jgi:hypothetical protein
MAIAWLKLRKRNLGPILDANGWAVNAKAKMNVPFGGALDRGGGIAAGRNLRRGGRICRETFRLAESSRSRLSSGSSGRSSTTARAGSTAGRMANTACNILPLHLGSPEQRQGRQDKNKKPTDATPEPTQLPATVSSVATNCRQPAKVINLIHLARTRASGLFIFRRCDKIVLMPRESTAAKFERAQKILSALQRTYPTRIAN